MWVNVYLHFPFAICVTTFLWCNPRPYHLGARQIAYFLCALDESCDFWSRTRQKMLLMHSLLQYHVHTGSQNSTSVSSFQAWNASFRRRPLLFDVTPKQLQGWGYNVPHIFPFLAQIYTWSQSQGRALQSESRKCTRRSAVGFTSCVELSLGGRPEQILPLLDSPLGMPFSSKRKTCTHPWILVSWYFTKVIFYLFFIFFLNHFTARP